MHFSPLEELLWPLLGKHELGTEWRPFDRGIATESVLDSEWMYILINIIIVVFVVCVSVLPGSNVCHREHFVAFDVNLVCLKSRRPHKDGLCLGNPLSLIGQRIARVRVDCDMERRKFGVSPVPRRWMQGFYPEKKDRIRCLDLIYNCWFSNITFVVARI